MNPDIENKIINNIFSKEQITRIYNLVNECPDEKKKSFNKWGQIVYYIEAFNDRYSGQEDLFETIEAVIQKEYGKSIRVGAIQFARYTLESGNEPNLAPHIDGVFEKPMLTCDIQMHATRPWPIVVNGKEFILMDNQALTFSGTHQVHWRTKIKFTKNDYVDMIFCHLEHSDMDNISSEHKVKMRDLTSFYTKGYK